MNYGLAIGAGLSLVGANKSSRAYKKAARQAAARGREQRVYNEIAAGQARAVGQITAMEEERQARLMASRAVAVAAAGGYTADITNLLADIDGEGAYRASLALHEAESRALSLEFAGEQAEKYGIDQAEAYEGQADAAMINAFGNLFGSGIFGG